MALQPNDTKVAPPAGLQLVIPVPLSMGSDYVTGHSEFSLDQWMYRGLEPNVLQPAQN
jgi:hypothetical protein